MSYAANPKDLYFDQKWGRDNVGSRGIGKQMITGRSVKSFQVLAASLTRHHGSKRKICEAIGITTGVLWQLENSGVLSKVTGQLIVNGHKAMSADKHQEAV